MSSDKLNKGDWDGYSDVFFDKYEITKEIMNG
jgi:hypothetical protein